MDAVEHYVRRDLGSVQGWLRPEAARLIADLVRGQDVSGPVGEIGVHHGKLFVLLSLCRRPGEAGVAVDLFEAQELNVDHSGAGDRARFTANLHRFDPDAATVTVRAADSTTLGSADLLALGGGPFRVVSVDGGHTAEITDHDLTVASGALARGGLLVLDDYFNVSWPGVSEGTNRFLARGVEVVAVGSGHGKTFLAHPEAADAYRTAIRSCAERQGWRVTTQPFFGEDHVIVTVRARRPVDRAKDALRDTPLPGAYRALRSRALSGPRGPRRTR